MKKRLYMTVVLCMVFALAAPALAFDVGEFRTQTQGGWGTSAQEGNPGAYRDANFASAFPDGLVVGSGNTLTLTSAAAVEGFMKQGGAPRALSGSFVDPVKLKNTFATQVVALALNLGFDAYDPDFGSSATALADLVVNAGEYGHWEYDEVLMEDVFVVDLVIDEKFDGMSVQEVMDLASAVLGGENTDYTPSEIADLVAAINENFADGEIEAFEGFLTAP
ncbi:MAG: hypothetical protein QMC96_05050 [Methanomicrobiales archaeon]|nr:hypothetical protein [Methanomicrobiales archaeon]